MGLTLSRNKNNTHLGKKNKNESKPYASKQVDEYEDVELMLLKRAIVCDPDSFILNNLMMCIQFFENYEEDIIQVKETLASTYESELNKVLPSQKHVLVPDILQEHISENIAFTSKRQTDDLIIEPLQPIRIYIVHDNFEITEQYYQSEYSSLNNGITYNMMVQPSEQPGYVRLRRLDEMPYARNSSTKEEDIDPSSTADDDEIYDGDGESVYGRNSNMMFSRQTRKRGLQTSSIFNVRSLPNLHDDETIYEDQISLSRQNIYGSRSNHDIKIESDCEHMSSMEDKRRHRKNTWSNSALFAMRESYQHYPRFSGARPKVRRPASISSSGYRSGACDSDSDCSYQTLPKPNVQATCTTNHSETVADAPTKIYSNARIPAQCFKKVRINSDGNIYMYHRERKPQNSKQFRLMMADRQYDSDVFYTSNEEFMNYFVHFFVDQLAEPLGFKPEDRNHVEKSVIYCDKIIELHSPRLRRIESYEISPTIWLQWPIYAQEWLDRPRSTWPEYSDIHKVKDFGCYVVPESSGPRKKNFLPKDVAWRHQGGARKNIHQEIEWQLTFPAAERYLETCLTRSQMQVYLIALMLHKIYLRPVLDTMCGLNTSHIRNKLFWLIEEDDRPSKWPDNRTGECLIKLLNSLYRCISSQNEPTLPDYFLRDKNVFSKVPLDYLLHSQKQLKRIIDNPVMYVFHAMENIRHSNKFFPRLNFTKLYNILTTKPRLAMMNPGLDLYLSPPKIDEYYREEIYNKSGGFWGKQKSRKQSSQSYSASVSANRTLITPRKADSIVEIPERCAALEDLRLAALLDFFITHFVKMAECCHRYRAYQQKKVYLDQADRLSIILSKMTRYKDDAKAYRKRIYDLRMKPRISLTRLQNEPPETPKRNVEPIFSGALKDRFTRQFAEIMKLPEHEQPQSSHENHTNEVITKTAAPEIRLTDEGNAQADTASAITSEDEETYTSRKPILKEQDDDSASGAVQKVVSLGDNLNEATYI